MTRFVFTQITMRVAAGLFLGGGLVTAGAQVTHQGEYASKGKTTSPSQVIESPIQDRQAVLDFWTDAQMTKAEEASGSAHPPSEGVVTPRGDRYGYAPTPTPYVGADTVRVNGILFYQKIDDAVAHCSASVITSQSKSLIVTAAHCLRDNRSRWATMMMFVPAYNGRATGDQRIPLMKWPVIRAFVPSAYGGSVDVAHDVAVARLFPSHEVPSGPGRPVEMVVGGGLTPHVNEDELFPHVTIMGYPGEYLRDQLGLQYWCLSRTQRNAFGEGIDAHNCGTHSGNSGGPLIIEGKNVVVGVVHTSETHARLRPSTFGVVFQAADASVTP